MPPLYHLLDAAWARAPLPARPRFAVEQVGPLPALRMWHEVGGRVFLSVYAYAVGDTLVDTGLAALGEPVVAFARAHGARRAVLTHHHEDHSGNAARLVAEGLDVRAAPPTAEVVAAGFPIKLYQHLFWGRAPVARTAPLGDTVPFGDRDATVVPAPGHCHDQVCFHVKSEGWLFSGDAFLHERVKLFREDEDFARTVSTLERLCALDFDVLFCAHRPRVTGGRAALKAKLDWLRDIEDRVRAWHGAGLGVREITRRLDLRQPSAFRWITFGDASTANLVRSILYGPRTRPSLARFEERLLEAGGEGRGPEQT